MHESDIDESLSFLVECFPEEKVEDLLDSLLFSSGSREEAIDHVLCKRECPDHFSSIDSGEDKNFKREIGLVYRRIDLKEPLLVLKKLFRCADESVLYSLLEGTFPEHCEIESPEYQKTLKSLVELIEQSGIQKSSKNFFKPIPIQYERSGFVPNILSGSESKKYNDLDSLLDDYFMIFGETNFLPEEAETLRDQANDMGCKRLELYRRASESHRQGGLTGFSSAQYYSQKANSMAHEMAKLNRKAAACIFMR